MEYLYGIAIKELSEIHQQDKDWLSDVSKKKDRKIRHNTFNKLPLNNIKNFLTPKASGLVLSDFILTLKILGDLDNKFRGLIEFYNNYSKGKQDYRIIESELISVILKYNNDIVERDSIRILNEAIEDIFSKEYQKKNLRTIYFYFYNKIFAYISEYYSDLLDQLADYYIRKLCIGIEIDQTAKTYIREQKKQKVSINNFLNVGNKFTFLSYAFHDKLMSFLLFLEARSEEIVLFVDWMYCENYEYETMALKENLSYFLKQTKKMLFLRSINSELNTSVTVYGLFAKNKKMVRQWCSWEIGNFYNHSSLSNYNNPKCQYVLHGGIDFGTEGDKQSIEENILLDNFRRIKRASDLY